MQKHFWWQRLHWPEYGSELLGTAFFIFIALSAVTFNLGLGSPLAVVLPNSSVRRLITGLMLAGSGSLVAISPLGKLSGAHLNPAVSLAFWLQGKMHLHDLVGYLASQLLGAALGAGLVVLIWRERNAVRHADATTMTLCLTLPHAVEFTSGKRFADSRPAGLGLRLLLEQQPDLTVVGEGGNGEQAIALAAALLPDVVLLDLLMPKMDGVTAVRKIKEITPTTQIIVLTSYYEDDQIFGVIKAGALSYLLKESSPEEVVAAVRAAATGESRLHPMVADRLLCEVQQRDRSPLGELTPRELEVLAQIARGRSNQEIATELSVSERTVKTHVSNILSKLHLADRTQAAIYALQQRLVPLKEALENE